MNDSRLSPTAWYALALVSLTNLMSLLDRNILAILAPRIKKDLGIGDAEMGLLYGTVFALFYALFSLPLGRLADGWTRTRLLAIALAFWSVAAGSVAFASGFGLLALSRLGVGIGEGASQPAGNSLLFDYFPKPRRGMVMGVLAAAIAVGLGGSLVLGGVVADWWDMHSTGGVPWWGFRGWQAAFLVAALPGVVVAALLWRLREPPRGHVDGIESRPDAQPFRASLAVLAAVAPLSNWFALAARRAQRREWLVNLGGLLLIVLAMGAATHWASAFSVRPPLHLGGMAINPHLLQWAVTGFGLYSILNLFQYLRLSDAPACAVITRSPSLLICMAVGSLQLIVNYGIMGFTPSFVMKTYGLSPAKTGLQFGLLAAAIGVLGPLLAGPISDRINRRFPGAGRSYVTLFSLGFSPLIALWVYTATDVHSFYWRFVLYSLVLTAWLPPLYATMFDQVLPRMRGLTASLYIIISTIFGLGIGPYLVGMVSDANGGHLGPAILSVNWVAPPIVVLLLVLARRAKRDEDQVVARARSAGEPA